MSILRIVDQNQQLQVFDLAEGGTFGREPGVDFMVNHPTVSRRHVAFAVRTGEVEMQDLGSANGTAVNGRALDRRPCLLQHGDQLRFGALEASFHSVSGDSDETLKRRPGAKGSRAETAPTETLLEHQMRLGRLAQRRMLVDRPPQIEGYELAHLFLPALGVGGDFIHWSQRPDGRHALVIGDVCGKGVPAALYMAYVSGLLHEIVPTAPTAVDMLERANRALHPILEPGMFITALAVLLDPAEHEIELACAGHGPALIKRSDGTIVETALPPGLALGLNASAEIGSGNNYLKQEELLCVFTDGVEEALDASGEEFNRWRVLDTLTRAAGAVDSIRRLGSAIARHSEAMLQHDDISVVTLERRG